MPNILDVDISIIEKTLVQTSRYNYGDRHKIGNKEYEYVYFHLGDGTVSGVKGQLVYYCISGTETVPSPYSVTMDVDTATKVVTNYNLGAGFLCSTPTATGDGVWIQKRGLSDTAVLTDQSVDIGDTIVATSGTNGCISGIAGGANHTSRSLGFATVADASTTAIAAGGIMIEMP